jgi:UDP-2,3-diacylglucosamine hydrolase
MTKHTLFISDLHLDPALPKVTNTFFYFLDHVAKGAHALYILGDFFESYCGDDDNAPFITMIGNALRRITANGLPIFFMQGNRDFLIGKSFAKRTGVTLITDPTVISLCNQSILLLHGDSLCVDDKSHQRFRKIVHNPIVQRLFLSLPLSVRQKIAMRLRAGSTADNQTKPAYFLDVNENAVSDALKKYHITKMIHGHTHKPQNTPTRIVLDAWHNHGNYLQVDDEGKMELINIPHE